MNDGKVPFKLKFLVGWSIIGLVITLIMAIQGIFADRLILSFLVSPLAGLFLGGVGFIGDAGYNWRWQFWNVTNYPWIWYLYPIFGALGLALFPLAFVWAIVSYRR